MFPIFSNMFPYFAILPPPNDDRFGISWLRPGSFDEKRHSFVPSQMTTEKKRQPFYWEDPWEDQWFIHYIDWWFKKKQTSTGVSKKEPTTQVSSAEHLTESTESSDKADGVLTPSWDSWDWLAVWNMFRFPSYPQMIIPSDVNCFFFLGLVESTKQTREFSPAP